MNKTEYILPCHWNRCWARGTRYWSHHLSITFCFSFAVGTATAAARNSGKYMNHIVSTNKDLEPRLCWKNQWSAVVWVRILFFLSSFHFLLCHMEIRATSIHIFIVTEVAERMSERKRITTFWHVEGKDLQLALCNKTRLGPLAPPCAQTNRRSHSDLAESLGI